MIRWALFLNLSILFLIEQGRGPKTGDTYKITESIEPRNTSNRFSFGISGFNRRKV